MPEDAAPDVESQETPDAPEASGPDQDGTPATPATDWESDDNPYKGRYNDLRPEYDRRNQQFSQYEQFVQNLSNPETQAEALLALGIELEGDEDDDDYADPTDQIQSQIERIESYLSEQAEQAALAETERLEQLYVEQELEALDEKLTKAERDLVTELAFRLRDEDGIPDIKGAFERLNAGWTERQKRYQESKRAPQVAPGEAGTQKIDLGSEDARVGLLADMLEAGKDA